MKISGTASLTAPPERVWEAFHDPESLARCLPGCNTLTEIGPHQYAMSITAGVAAIKGTYDGQVHLTEQQHPEAFTLKAKGSGAPGTVDAGYRGEVKVLLVNLDPREPVELRRGDRVAQLVLQRVERAGFVEVDALPDSARGAGGYGSTGGFGPGPGR